MGTAERESNKGAKQRVSIIKRLKHNVLLQNRVILPDGKVLALNHTAVALCTSMPHVCEHMHVVNADVLSPCMHYVVIGHWHV